MNWVIVIIVCLSLIGSVLWVMPSPRDRMQAAFRQKAMALGMQVQMKRLDCPRAIGEAQSEPRDYIGYRLNRKQQDIKTAKTQPWQVFKLKSHATNGLPEGWCWGQGENILADDQLAVLGQTLESLPLESFALESTPLSVALFWRENGNLAQVDAIHQMLQSLIDNKL